MCQNLFIAKFVVTFQVPEYQLFHTLINWAENSASLLQYLKQLLQTQSPSESLGLFCYPAGKCKVVPTAAHFWDNILQVAGMSYWLE